MVLPLIPAVLLGVGALAGGGGLALGGKGAFDLNKASGDMKKSRIRYETRHDAYKKRVAATDDRINELGRQQSQALTDSVLRMGEFVRRHQMQVRDRERLLVEGIDATMSHVPGLGKLDVETGSWIGGLVGSATVAAGTGAGVTAVATGVGVTGTGAAISGLSGVAAESATLAFLGGGSLAAGGGGMALGALALNVVAIAPALLMGGIVTKSQGAKAVTKAKAYQAEVAVAVAALAEANAQLDAVDARVDELSMLLTKLTRRSVEALDLLESEPFDPDFHAENFQRALKLAMAVRDVASAPIIDPDSGELSTRSATLTVKYRSMTEEMSSV
jgi:hypothetical protein